jgi:hypothetical protein
VGQPLFFLLVKICQKAKWKFENGKMKLFLGILIAEI